MFDNFINGIKNGFNTANAVRKLVFADKELFLYPIFSTILAIIFGVLAFGLLLFLFLTGAFNMLSNWATVVILIIVFYLLYLAVFFVSTYFAVAMLIAFREYTKGKGKSISFSESLNRTKQYFKIIVEWSIFYTIIATILHIIEAALNRAGSRFGVPGFVVSRLISGAANLGLAAAVAFSLPVIIDEKTSPIETIKTSTKFIMNNFGDTFGGLIFTEIFQIIFAVIGILFILGGVFALVSSASSLVAAIGIVLVIVGVILIITGVVLRYVLFNCFKLIVYDYKTRKVLPKGFDSKIIENSIRKKQKGQKPGGINPLSFGMGQQGGL